METTSPTNLVTANNKIESILAQKTITPHDLENLTPTEHRNLEKKISHTLAELKGGERDNFLAKIAPIIATDSNNNIWEHNHALVSTAIAELMNRHGTMPSQNAIARETGLSRQTVAKHIAEYNSHPEYIAETNRFKFMSHTLLAKVFRHAGNGDMRAARIYFDMVGTMDKQQTGTVNTQNNYIQINNTILSQDKLKSLTEEQLNLIEKIVNNKA